MDFVKKIGLNSVGCGKEIKKKDIEDLNDRNATSIF